ncbi:transcriptional regulator, partial [Streptomyces sp. NPDC058953]
GCTLHTTLRSLVTWTEQHQNDIAAARAGTCPRTPARSRPRRTPVSARRTGR